ncbi:Nitrilase [compost metagenome]
MKIGYGFAKIIAPNGHVISNTLKHDEEGIVYADIDLKQIIPGKFLIDHAGHYSTPGFLSLNFDKSVHEPVRVIGKSKPSVIGYEAIQNS